mmetsp:Transcript_13852/g.16794  ORF Transcript_13852/g.16794 Transcript_13852/m.16794 type:complete len:570 (-) Transcript_13852:1144-2853(-)
METTHSWKRNQGYGSINSSAKQNLELLTEKEKQPGNGFSSLLQTPTKQNPFSIRKKKQQPERNRRWSRTLVNHDATILNGFDDLEDEFKSSNSSGNNYLPSIKSSMTTESSRAEVHGICEKVEHCLTSVYRVLTGAVNQEKRNPYAETNSLSSYNSDEASFPDEQSLLLGPPAVEIRDNIEDVHHVSVSARHTVSVIPRNDEECEPITFKQKYALGSLIGEGTSSNCYKCVRLSDGKEFACKVINMKRLCTTFPRSVVTKFKLEIDTLQILNHPNIIRLEDHFCGLDKIYIVLELINGGELFERIVDSGGLPEDETQQIFVQLAQAIQYMHSKGVIHRDIKPENVLVTADESMQVKIIDFGFSKVMDEPFAESFMGTGGFLAPELCEANASYSSAVDIWALGVTLYIILSCFLPFDRSISPKPKSAYALSFSDPVWADVSDGAKHLLRCLLHPNPDIRYTADQIMTHPWVKDGLRKRSSKDPKKLAMLSKLQQISRSHTWTIPLNKPLKNPDAGGSRKETDNESSGENKKQKRLHWTPEIKARGVLLSRDLLPISRSSSCIEGKLSRNF